MRITSIGSFMHFDLAFFTYHMSTHLIVDTGIKCLSMYIINHRPTVVLAEA